MDLRSKKGLYKVAQTNATYYFYVIENTEYELIGHYFVVDDDKLIHIRWNKELTISNFRDNTLIWSDFKESDDFRNLITYILEVKIDG